MIKRKSYMECKMEESCDEIFNILLFPYFKNASSHCAGIDQPFTANFYVHRVFPNFGKIVQITGPGLISHKRNFKCVDDVFYDRNSESKSPNHQPNSPNIRINYNGTFAGVLCPETQTLWATDWTHDMRFCSMVATILDYLRKAMLLKFLEG